MVEVVVSALLVGVVLIGAMDCVGAVIRGRLGVGNSGKAAQLLRQLMSEILEQDYLEPFDPPAFGLESPESTTVRIDWDDVDDYHLWSASPPQDRSGTPLSNLTGWQREVSVEWVDPSNPATTVVSDQGVKRITVTVRRDGNILAQETALRTDKYTEN
jgi:hypothetical protein